MRKVSCGRLAAAVLAAAVLAAGCGGDDDDNDDALSSTTTTTSTTTTAPPTTTTIHDGPVAPFTGLPVADEAAATASVLVVKIGNNDNKSRPQVGLIEADIVIEELVESLKTRFFSVFQSTVPAEVGPVRSGRTSDIDLLVGLGTPMFASSGGNPTVLGAIRRAVADGVLIDVGVLRLESPYYRNADRPPAPYNLFVRTDELSSDAAGEPSPLFTYGELAPGVGQRIGGVDVQYPASFGRGSTHLWDPELDGWVRIQDDTLHTALVDGVETEIAPTNVVLASVVYGQLDAVPSSPDAHSFGEGPVQVFTRGREIQGTWSRSEDDGAWILRDFAGDEIPLAPGTTWLLLAAAQNSAFPQPEITTFSQVAAAEMLAAARAEFVKSAAS